MSNFKQPVASTERPWLRVVPDTTWALETIRERFEVPSDTPSSLVEVIGRRVAQKAIERYERLRHWRFRDDIPVRLDLGMQTDLDLTSSPLLKLNDLSAMDSGILHMRTGRTAYVMELTFETQEIVKYEESVGRPEGFINEDENPRPGDIEREL